MTLQEILIRAYFVLLSSSLLLLYAYYVRRSIARKFKHIYVTKFTAACCNVWTSYRSWSYLFATLPCDESLSCFKIVGLPLYAEAVSALFFFLCLIRHDLKPINMKNCGNFHFPTRLKISYIINSLKDLYRILWRMRVKTPADHYHRQLAFPRRQAESVRAVGSLISWGTQAGQMQVRRHACDINRRLSFYFRGCRGKGPTAAVSSVTLNWITAKTRLYLY